jgi:hypothetical protein
MKARVLAATAALTLIGTACGRSPPGVRTRPARQASPEVRGTLLTVEVRFAQLFRMTLPGGRRRMFPAPGSIGGGSFGAAIVAALPEPDGTVLVFYHPFGGATRLFRQRLGGKSEPVGPGLPDASEPFRVGHLVVTSTCLQAGGEVVALDISNPTKWRPLAAGCAPVLSPDGTMVAFARTERGSIDIWQVPVDGSRPPSLLFAVSSLPELRATGILHPELNGNLAWGPGGLAIQVFQSNAQALVVRRPTGEVRVIDLGQATAQFTSNVRWQPNGNLLAFVGSLQAGGVVLRVLDPDTGTTRVLATDPQGFGRPLWSPDGKAVAVSSLRGELIITDLGGRWLSRYSSAGSPLAWTA